MARLAAAISQPGDLLAAAAAVGRARGLAAGLARSARHAGRARPVAMGRDLSGCHVLSGEKGGFAVGKTKRGKGTKAVVLADGEGIPLGVCIASATPNEVTLAEPTLAAVWVPRRGRGCARSGSSPIAATTAILCVGDCDD